MVDQFELVCSCAINITFLMEDDLINEIIYQPVKTVWILSFFFFLTQHSSVYGLL